MVVFDAGIARRGGTLGCTHCRLAAQQEVKFSARSIACATAPEGDGGARRDRTADLNNAILDFIGFGQKSRFGIVILQGLSMQKRG